MNRLAIALLATAALAPGAAFAVSFTQNAAHQTTAIAGLNYDPTCERRAMVGRVVKRTFEGDALTLRGFVVEKPDGARGFINVATTGITGVEAEIVANGLQRLTKVGRVIHGHVVLCGVSGEVEELDDIH